MPEPSVIETLQPYVAAGLVGVLIVRAASVRTHTNIAAARCPACRYSLAGLPSDAFCPECGSPERVVIQHRLRPRLRWVSALHLFGAWFILPDLIAGAGSLDPSLRIARHVAPHWVTDWLYDAQYSTPSVFLGFLCAAVACIWTGRRARWALAYAATTAWALALLLLSRAYVTGWGWNTLESIHRSVGLEGRDVEVNTAGVAITALALACTCSGARSISRRIRATWPPTPAAANP